MPIALDQEIQMGLLNEKHPNLKSIAFFREIENVEFSQISDTTKETELEVKILLNELKLQVKRKLSVPNRYLYQVLTFYQTLFI